MKKTKRNWRLRIVILAYCVPILAVVFLTGVLSYMKKELRERLDGNEYRAMLRFFEEPVSFPEEWAEVTPYSTEFKNELVKARGVFEKWEDRREELAVPERILSGTRMVYVGGSGPTKIEPRSESLLNILARGCEITTEEWRLAEKRVVSTSPVIQALVALSEVSDYDLSAMLELHISSPGVRLLSLQSHLLAREKNWEDALEANLVVLRLARRHPASPLVTHLVGIASELCALRSTAPIVVDCDDREALKTLLEEIQNLDPKNHFDNLHRVPLVDSLGILRADSRRLGVSVDLTPGHPRAFYWRQLWGGKAIEVSDLRKTDDVLVMMAVSAFGGSPTMMRILWIDRLLYADYMPNFMEARIREMVCRSEFDLVRLLVANRIRELESGRRTSDPADLVPEWMPEMPVDSFTLDPFLWDATHENFYSVGPDRLDSGNVVRYGPTNGTKSVGDISLP
jgi:hypothetical protein